MYVGLRFVLFISILLYIIAICSVVALCFRPPACASVILIFFTTLSLIIRSNIFPTLLLSVIPLSDEHFPFVPFPL